ncbi:MAG TPA: M48 family metalloprotease [Candidatus Saccharimonadales bacterium]|nr:M48 family metalloprotease [Candidatus Saccharimonadales bacterium]
MYTQIAANKRRSWLLTIGFVGFVSILGYVFARATNHPGIFVFAGLGSLAYATIGYYASAQIALSLSGAREVAKKDAPELYRIVENLAITAGLPMPRVYIIDDPSPNAFATGRDPKHAVVAVTTGILEVMEKEELEGVLAHELSHVGNYDIRFMAIVMVLVTVVSLLSDFFFRWNFFGGDDEEDNNPVFMIIGIVLAILAPIVATLLQLAVSRRREYLADASGALLTRYPEGLARALEKIEHAGRPLRHASTANAHMYISNPLAGRKAGALVANLFSTHPPIEDRIRKLRDMEGKV